VSIKKKKILKKKKKKKKKIFYVKNIHVFWTRANRATELGPTHLTPSCGMYPATPESPYTSSAILTTWYRSGFYVMHTTQRKMLYGVHPAIFRQPWVLGTV